jgi:lipoate-protein ligase A
MSGSKKHNSDNKNPACFKSMSYGEIKVNGKKIIGSAQKRYKNGFLQHGSILMSFNSKEMHNVLICNDDADFNDIGAIREYSPDLSQSQLILSLKDAFEKELGVKLVSDNPSKFELSLAKELEQNKYSTEKWNFVR